MDNSNMCMAQAYIQILNIDVDTELSLSGHPTCHRKNGRKRRVTIQSKFVFGWKHWQIWMPPFLLSSTGTQSLFQTIKSWLWLILRALVVPVEEKVGQIWQLRKLPWIVVTLKTAQDVAGCCIKRVGCIAPHCKFYCILYLGPNKGFCVFDEYL